MMAHMTKLKGFLSSSNAQLSGSTEVISSETPVQLGALPRALLMAGFFSLLIGFLVFYSDDAFGFRVPDEAFLLTAIACFQLMVLGRLMASRRKEFVLLIFTDGAFVGAAMSVLTNPSFGFGRWDYFLFMTLMTTAFITGGFLTIRKVDFRAYGMATAFVASFFYEMFGIPLTLYLLNALFEKNFPVSGRAGLDAGHLWVTLGLIDMGLAHALSAFVIVIGATLVLWGHLAIHSARGEVVVWGIYKYVKHPQYIGISLVTGGMLIEFPTFLTLVMWAALLGAYTRLARKESREIRARLAMSRMPPGQSWRW